MEKLILGKYQLALLIAILFFTLLSTCNSRTAKKYGEAADKKIDSLEVVIQNTNNRVKDIPAIYTAIKVEGLKTEKRTLLNTNQIFLTKKRPGTRVIEIDKELGLLENKK